MIDKSIIVLFLFWYFYTYGRPYFITKLIIRAYYLSDDFFLLLNKTIHGDFWYDYEDYNVVEKNDEKQVKETLNYEDKYLADIRRINKEWEFTEEENNLMIKLIEENKINNEKKLSERMEKIIKEIIYVQNDNSEDDSFTYIEKIDEDEEIINRNSFEDKKGEISEDIKLLQEEYNKIKLQLESEEGLNELRKQYEEEAKQYIINERLDKLDNCYVIEKTPIGNVLMIYDKNRETFKYYSDCNIPYRYLEVIGRKYVKFFGCRPIFIDMEEELRLFEEKWEKDQEIKKIKEEEDKKAEIQKDSNEINKKKNVFTKFKSYNKEAVSKISMAAPPKNSIPNKTNVNKENEKILLKEKANRYTYEGKFANFNFLKKIEKKVFNKKLGLSFSDFKKMKN